MSARRVATLLALLSTGIVACAGAARAQVINGQSTDDAAYAPRPPARWHSPESEGEVPGGKAADDEADRGARSEKPRR